MNCEECRIVLLDGLESLPRGEADAAREHLRECRECAAIAQRLSRLDQLVRNRAIPPAERARLAETIAQARLLARRPQARARRIVAMRWRLAAAAVALISSGVGFFLLWGGHSASPPEGELLERLVEANLSLSEAGTPAEKTMIFGKMVGCFYDTLVQAAAAGDADEATFAADNFEKLLQQGVIAHARLLQGEELKQTLVPLQSNLVKYSTDAEALAAKSGSEVKGSIERVVAAAQSARKDAERILGG